MDVLVDVASQYNVDTNRVYAIGYSGGSTFLGWRGFEFQDVFARQVEGLVQSQDLVIGLSTSGDSPNVVKGVSAAKALGAKTVAMTGRGGALAEIADIAIQVPSNSVARIQEAHITLGHIICEMAQRLLTKEYMTRFTS